MEISRDPGARIRDISAAVGLTERTVQAIVADPEAAGYLTRTRTGRRVRYTVSHDSLFRHPRPGRTAGRPVPQPARGGRGGRPSTPGTADSEMEWRQTLCGRKMPEF